MREATDQAGAFVTTVAACDLFDGVDPGVRRTAAAIVTSGAVTRLAAGGRAQVPDGSQGIFLVASGDVELVAVPGDAREVVLATARGGELLVAPTGGGHAETLGLSALRESVVCAIDEERLHALGRAPRVLLNLLAAVAARTEEAQRAAVRLAHRRVEDRVLLALRAVAGRDGRVTADGIRLPPIRHRDLARLANVTRPGATQAIATLCRAGLLARSDAGALTLPTGP